MASRILLEKFISELIENKIQLIITYSIAHKLKLCNEITWITAIKGEFSGHPVIVKYRDSQVPCHKYQHTIYIGSSRWSKKFIIRG